MDPGVCRLHHGGTVRKLMYCFTKGYIVRNAFETLDTLIDLSICLGLAVIC